MPSSLTPRFPPVERAAVSIGTGNAGGGRGWSPTTKAPAAAQRLSPRTAPRPVDRGVPGLVKPGVGGRPPWPGVAKAAAFGKED